jgi:predicted phosphodiesterase
MEELRVKADAFQEDLGRGRMVPKSMHHCDMKTTFSNVSEAIDTVVAMSDIHTANSAVVDKLIKTRCVNKRTIVICTGDMAGNGKMGGNADPIKDYVRLRDAAAALYLVQGNHDVHNSDVLKLVNSDGTWCCVDQRAVDTPIGRIAGVNGIILPPEEKENQPEKHKYVHADYMRRLQCSLDLKPDILLTHTPLSDVDHEVRLHLFGHDHYDEYIDLRPNGQLRLNMDSRVFVFHRGRK